MDRKNEKMSLRSLRDEELDAVGGGEDVWQRDLRIAAQDAWVEGDHLWSDFYGGAYKGATGGGNWRKPQ